MAERTHRTLQALALALTLATAGCSDGAKPTNSPEVTAPNETVPATTKPAAGSSVATGQVASGPAPTEMCGGDDSLAVAAYDLAIGAFKWAACGSGDVRRGVLEASDEAVYLEVFVPDGGAQELVAYDAATGEELPNGGPAESRPTLPINTGATPRVLVDGIRIEGGQDDPTSAIDATTGDVLWTKPGSPAYDDVWAVGDGAVYVINHQAASPGFSGPIVAYELTTGEVRWTIEADTTDVQPWHVAGGVLLAIWTNLAVISTGDGSTIWRTQYPSVEFPRMTGVRANSDTVFVAFSSVASGGD